uniref:DDE_Tnp_IS1595 domain-containing protein n=1 Tax=Meloidogyne hapla TaxID=6305 RepID=A0A1I8BGP1_MELHA
MWNHKKIIRTFETEALAIKWSKNNRLLQQTKYCSGQKYEIHRKTLMKFQNFGTYGRFYCSKCRCSNPYSNNQKHVHEGSEIKTDAWRAYSTLGQNGYTHRVVNHSDPENRFISRDGVNTQRIEANWRPAKDWFRQRRLPGYRFPDALVEYQWRRECKKMNLDPFEQLICAIVANYNFK